MFKKKKTVAILLLVLVMLLGFTISVSADEEFPPSVEPTVLRSEATPFPFTQPPSVADLFTLDSSLDFFSPRVIGGVPVTPENKYPWMVYEVWFGEHLCTGTLISDEWILTAAHCWVSPSDAPPFYNVIIPSTEQMILGEYDLSHVSGHEQILTASEIYVHPNYDPFYYNYDVALLKLSTPATINEYVQPIALADSSYTNSVLSNFDATVTGWGAIDSYWDEDCDVDGDGEPDGCTAYIYPDIIQEATVDFLADSECSSGYGASYDPTSMICIGKTDGSADTCFGDSGGPAAFQENGVWKQAGITSWGNECAVPGFPGVYTRISAIYDWIHSYIGTTTQIIPLNNSFEEEMPSGWMFAKGTDISDGRDCTVRHTGTCSWALTGNDSRKEIIYHYRPDGAAGDKIDFSIWRKGVNTSGTGYAAFVIYIIHQDGSYQKQIISLESGTMSNWEKFSGSLIASEDYQLITATFTYKKPGGTVWVDDISMTKNGTVQISTNNSFELSTPVSWWFANGTQVVDGRNCSQALLDDCSWAFVGNDERKEIRFHYLPDGSAGDKIEFSIWRKGYNTTGVGYMALVVYIIHNDLSYDKQIVDLSPGTVAAWQKFSGMLIASEDYQLITVTVTYKKPGGTLWVDNIQATKFSTN